MITHHTQLLNFLIERYNLQSYCEIGVQNPANNFDKVKIHSTYKFGCDPEVSGHHIFKMTSDDFFAKQTGAFKFDLVFIDGLHTSEQVKKDFDNALACLNDNGFIVLHDTMPENEKGANPVRETKQWWGDVYKFAMTLHTYGLHYFTLDCDNGCTVVMKKPVTSSSQSLPTATLDWTGYQQHGRELLRVIKPQDIEAHL